MTYLDTSFLVKAYFPEIGSDGVNAFLQSGPLVSVSPLIDLEMHAAAYRKVDCAEAERILKVYDQDRDAGVYRETAIPADVHRLAQQLAKQLCSVVRLRSLDLLHLAIAIEARVDTLATFDIDLGVAAKASGLAVVGARP